MVAVFLVRILHKHTSIFLQLDFFLYTHQTAMGDSKFKNGNVSASLLQKIEPINYENTKAAFLSLVPQGTDFIQL
jgi:hypothetical protein